MWAQVRVEPVTQSIRYEVLRDVAMGNLRQRMDAGIGAARAVHADAITANRLHCRLQRALYRGTVVLVLPAAEGTSVIFDGQLVAGHQTSRSGGVSGVPFRKAPAFIGGFPARCNSRMRIAPSPQAIVRRSSRRLPGDP